MKTTSRLTHVAAVVTAALLTCTFAISALAEDCPELVGRLPGPVSAVAVSSDYAYLGTPEGLLVADVSDPSVPWLIGEVTLPGYAHDVAVSGGYAYVAWSRWTLDSEEGGLRVIDVSTPSAPVEVGFVDTPGEVVGVAVEGGYAYLTAGEAGLRVVDVSTPSAPVEVASADTPGAALGVAVSGNYAYVATSEGLVVFDVSSPSAPVEVGFVDTPDSAIDVAVAGTYAYVAAGMLRVVDVSDPAAPVEVGFYSPGSWGGVLGVAVAGSYAYVAADGLRVVDVSNPAAPFEVGSWRMPGVNGVAVAGSYAYVAAGDWGLRVIDVSTPSAPVEVGFVDTPGSARDVAVSGGYAYVADGGGLRMIDVTTPSAPVEVGFIDTIGEVNGVAVADDYAYVVGDGFRVIDVSTPSAPVEVGYLALGGSGVAVSGDYAYVAGNWGFHRGRLWVVDVSHRSAPVEVGFVDMPEGEHSFDVAVEDGYAFVTSGFFGLRVIDVSMPSAPVEVGFVETWGPATSVAVSGGYAYVGGWIGFWVIDVSTPSEPLEVGFIEPPGHAFAVAVSHGYAYVACNGWSDDERDGLGVIDVSMPSEPIQVGFADVPSNPQVQPPLGVAVSDGHVYFAAGEAGLYIFNECAHQCYIPAAAVAAGAQGAFFQTDVEINNTGTEEAEVSFQWLPRGEDNSDPVTSEPVTLAAGQSLRWENVLTELFGLEPDSLGALKLTASTESVIGMSRTYNIPAGKAAGTFGQGLPAIRATEMIQGSEPQRIIFLSEDPDSRANVGCVNGTGEALHINIELFDDEGTFLESRTMDLGPYSNNQINRVFEDYAPVNGYVDVWADRIDALYYCYGSMLDNETSDPTTILPQVPSADTTFIPAAALAAGLEGSFFTTDLDLNNVGSTDLTYELLWLPRGADNSAPVSSETFSLAPGAGVRYANVLDEVFGLEPDQVGALAVEASGIDLLAMSRTYNLPSAKVAGTFGQELPGIPADRMIPTGVSKRIIFLSENDDVRANVGCVNGAGTDVAVQIELYDSDGVKLETRYMMLPPFSNRQINGIFEDYAPVNGYVDVRTYTPDATIYCYGSVLDNSTSDPTTVLPQ